MPSVPIRNAWRSIPKVPFARLAPAYTADVLDAPLRTSIVPAAGASVTFARNSIATVADFENVTRVCKPNEARFFGARRVENGFANSEGAQATLSSKANIADAVLPLAGFANALQVLQGAGVAFAYRAFTTVVGRTYLLSVFVQMDDASMPVLGANVSAGDMSLTVENGLVPGTVSPTPTPGLYRVWVVRSIANGYSQAGLVRYGTQSGKGFRITGMQIEDVTSQTVQTPGEYVSTGVLAWPFHGAGVDGVRYFDTRLDGTPLVGCAYRVEPQRTQYLRSLDNLNALPWGGAVAATFDGKMVNGRPAWRLEKTTTATSEAKSQSVGTLSGWVTLRFLVWASENSTQCIVGIYGGGWGADVDSNASKVSGPGLLSRYAGGAFYVAALSSTVPTIVVISRYFAASASVLVYAYPDTSSSAVIGKANYIQFGNLEPGQNSTSDIPNASTTDSSQRLGDVLNYSLPALPASNLTIAATIKKMALPRGNLPANSPLSIGDYTANGYVSLGGYTDMSTGDTIIGSWPNVWDIVSSSAGGVFQLGQSTRAVWSFAQDGKTWRRSFNGTLQTVGVASTAKSAQWSSKVLGIGCIGGVNGADSAVTDVSNLRIYSTAHPPEVITLL